MNPTTTARWILPVLTPLILVLVMNAVLRTAPPGVLWGSAGRAAVWGLALVAGLVVAVLICVLAGRWWPALRPRRSSGSVVVITAVAAAMVLLTAVSGRITPLPIFEGLQLHWQGKVLDLLWLGILVAMFPRWARDEVGLRWRITRGSGRVATVMIIAVFGLFVALTLWAVAVQATPVETVGIERLAFNATLPNLTEELLWRGALLGVLGAAFATSGTLLGAPVGPDIVITAFVFGLGHTIVLDASGGWGFSLAGGLFAAAMGLAMGWIRARTGSLWPAFLLHCAPELGVDLGMIIAG